MINFKDSIFGKIPNTWSILEAENYCLKVTDGTHDSPKQTTIGYPLITSRHIKGSEIDFDNAYLISKEDYDSINKRSYVSQWDVIISMIGEYCGFTYLEENSDINYAIKNVGLFKTEDELKGKWLYYFFQSKSVNHLLNTYRSGTSQPYLALGTLRKFPILIPQNNQEIQQVVSILDSLRKKIDNLRAQNDTLEKTAQTLFTEWFGKYQVEDELPEGWEVKSLDKIALHLKKNIKPFNEPDKDFAHYSLPAFDNGLKPVKEKGIEIKSNKYSVVNWSFLVSKLNPFTPRIWTIYESENNRICSTEFQVVKPKKDIYFSLIHCLLNSSRFTSDLSQKVKGTSSSHQRVNPKDIFDINLIIPNMEVLSDFNKVVYPMILKKNINHQQIQSLTKTRDTLLPKLMSGQLRVKNIETLELAEK